MEWLLLVVTALGGSGCLFFYAQWQKALVMLRKEARDLDTLAKQTEEGMRRVAAAAEELSQRHTEEKARLEAVIKMLREEIASLEVDTRACASPATVRDRLRKLLSNTSAKSTPGAKPATGAPDTAPRGVLVEPPTKT